MGLLTNVKARKLGVIMTIIALVLVGIQLVKPEISHPPVTGEFEGPLEVKNILHRACYNCHSNETQLEWFDKVAPASWIVASDVANARKAMNFSEWNEMTEVEKRGKFWEVVNMLIAGKMPLKSYKAVHSSGSVSGDELEILKKYAKAMSFQRPGDSSKVNQADREYQSWKNSAVTSTTSKSTSLNGISYFNDFKSWKVISTSANNVDVTIRVIYGNDIAVKAIEAEDFHPWPNGAIIVKAVWDQLEDSLGSVRPGKFENVQIMIKNDQQYPDTEGWGYAKFFGLKLVPGGKTPSYGIACSNCHQLAKENGFVFNVPPKIK